MLKLSLRLIFPLFFLTTGLLHAQDQALPNDSLGTLGFLKTQKKVPGMGYRFIFSDVGISEAHVSDSLFRLVKTDSGYVSTAFTDFSWIEELEKPLLVDSLPYLIQLMVYELPISDSAANDYVADLIRNGDYEVIVKDDLPEDDLVALASTTPYSPFQQFKLKFVSDFKLFAVTVFILFFLLVAFLMIVSLLVLKRKKIRRENLKNEYQQIVIDPLTSLLFEKELGEILALDDAEIHAFFPKNLLAKSLFQQVLIDGIIGLNKKMKGEFKDKLKAIYKRLKLNTVSIKSLQSRKWDTVTMGLVQINEMDLVEALPEVKKFTNSSNFHIRSKATSTILNLSESVDLGFLRDQTFPLSLWQQMNYMRIIRFVSSQKEVNLMTLFDSKNRSIRIFGIKLVRVLGKVELIEVLAGFAERVSDEEKIEILETYAALGAHMEVGFINKCLKSPNQTLSILAAKVAAVIGDSESVDALIELLQSEKSFGRKLIYYKSLKELNEERFDLTTLNNPSPELLEIRRHILDPMLQNV